MTVSISIAVVAGTLAASVTVTLPPAAATVADPVELALPLFTARATVADPHDAGIEPTVTLATLLPERFGMKLSPAVVQRGTVTVAAPRLLLTVASDAANAELTPIEAIRASPSARRFTAGRSAADDDADAHHRGGGDGRAERGGEAGAA